MKKICTLLFLLCTMVMALHAQYTEDFETGFDGWIAENIWKHGDFVQNQSNGFPIPSHTDFMAANDDAAGENFNGSGRLISPAFDLTGLDSPFLRFEAYFPNFDYAGANETAKVLVSTDSGVTWEEITELEGNGSSWYTVYADVSEYGNQTIQIAFEYNDGGVWNYGLCIDDIEFYQAPANDVRLVNFNIERFLPAGDMPVAIEVSNRGYETVTELEYSWTDGTSMNTETLTGLNIEPLKTVTVVHPTTFTDGMEAKQFDLAVAIDKPNGLTDANIMDNGSDGRVSFVVDVPTKVVVAEDKTGTWCIWCPRGDVFLRQMIANYPDNFIGIAVHDDDPMEDAEYNEALSAAFPEGYPNVIMARDQIMDPFDMPSQMDNYLSRTAPVSVKGSAKYDGVSNEVEVTMTVTAHTEIDGVRFNVSAVLVENEMSGTTSDWAQINAYAGGGFGPMGGYENLPNPVPASQMVYDHVGRRLIGDFAGDATVVPSSLVDGSTATTILKASVPTDGNLEKMNVVLLVTDRETGEIYNAGETPLTGIYPKFESSAAIGCGPFEVQFMDVSDSTASYAWTFEGGTPATSTEKNPTVVFNGEGSFDVSLTAISNTGNSYTITSKDAVFLDKQTTADFDYEIDSGGKVYFTNKSSNAFLNEWDFGDGGTSTQRNPTRVFAAFGLYNITLRTINGTCSDEYSEEIEVQEYPVFSSSTAIGCGPFEVQFTDVSDFTASYAWTFEGGTPATSTEKNPTVVFDGEGYRDVSLTAISNAGVSYLTIQEDLIFLDSQPTAEFGYEINGGLVEFKDSSSQAIGYEWDFGNGEMSTQTNPNHEYTASGFYTVTLRTENGTCSDESSEEIEVILVGLHDAIETSWNLSASPNPFNEEVVINYDLANSSGQSQLVVYNYLGKELFTQDLDHPSGNVRLGEELPQGVFFVQVRQDQKSSPVLKVTKVR